MEFLRRVLIVLDATTAGGSLPRLCVDRASPGLMSCYTGDCCTEIHIPCVVRQVQCAIGGVMRDAWFA